MKDPLSPDRPTPKEGQNGKPANDFRTRVLAELKEKQESLERLSSEIQDHPDRADLYMERGCLRLSSADGTDPDLLSAAIADFNRALGLAPNHFDARLWRGHALALAKDYEAALADLSWVLQRQPDHYAARVERGQILAEKGETDRAIADFDRAASAHPHEVESTLLTWRGWCHSTKGDYQGAVADLTRAIEGFPVEITVWIERARCYLEMADLERARFDIEEVLQLRPEELSAHFLRLDLLSRRGAFGAAAAEAGRLRELLPDQPGPYLLRAALRWLAVHQRNEFLAEVVRGAGLVEQVLPCGPVPRLVRASATGMVGLGRPGVRADLDRSIALEPRFPLLYALRAALNVSDGKFAPTCRDVALIFLTRHPARYTYHFHWSIDWEAHRYKVEFWWKPKDHTDQPDPKAIVSDPNQECMHQSVQQLLAAAFGLR